MPKEISKAKTHFYANSPTKRKKESQRLQIVCWVVIVTNQRKKKRRKWNSHMTIEEKRKYKQI